MAAPPIQIITQFNKIPDLIKNLPTAVDKALDKGAALIEGAAKANAPVLTGALRASGYRITPLTNDYDANVAQAEGLNPDMQAEEPGYVGPHEAVVGFAAHYAGYVHDGTARMAGRPFLMEATERYREEVAQLIATAIEDTANEAVSSVTTTMTTASEPPEAQIAEGVLSGE